MSTTVAKTRSPSARVDRGEADLHGKHASVLATSRQLKPDPVGASHRVGEEAIPVHDVTSRQTLGQEAFDRFVEQLVPFVPEGNLRLTVQVGDPAKRIDGDDRVGGGVEDGDR